MGKSSTHPPVFVAAAACTLAVLIGACAHSEVPESTADATAFAILIEGVIEEAASEGGSPEQVQILHEARSTGAVSPELMRQSLNSYGGCVEATGMTYDWGEPTGPIDYPTFHFRVNVPLDVDQSLMDACYREHAQYVNAAYQLQPATRQAQSELLVAHRDLIIECLRGADVEIAENASADEIALAVKTAFTGIVPGEIDAPPPGFKSRDCAAVAGLDIRDVP